MTDQETARFYEARQRYREKCEDFKQEITKFFENYGKPRNTHHLPQLRA